MEGCGLVGQFRHSQAVWLRGKNKKIINRNTQFNKKDSSSVKCVIYLSCWVIDDTHEGFYLWHLDAPHKCLSMRTRVGSSASETPAQPVVRRPRHTSHLGTAPKANTGFILLHGWCPWDVSASKHRNKAPLFPNLLHCTLGSPHVGSGWSSRPFLYKGGQSPRKAMSCDGFCILIMWC